MTITESDTQRGLYGKYRVERVDGKDKWPYFVLAPNTDPFAVAALREYAMECCDTHASLAADLEAWADAAEDLHPEHFPPYQPAPEPTDEERRADWARAMGPQIADRADLLWNALQEIRKLAEAWADDQEIGEQIISIIDASA